MRPDESAHFTMVNNKDKAFKVGDLVEAIGLVGASHLNGKWGWITRNINSSGRLAVRFDDYADDEPKLIKRSNLMEPSIPAWKNDPRGMFRSPNGESTPILIEKGEGKECCECGCDLGGKHHVLYEGKYLCEEHYVDKYSPVIACTCAICHEYVSLRDRKALPTEVFKHDDICGPNAKSSDGRPLLSPGGIYGAHSRCFSCNLCGDPMYQCGQTSKADFLVKLRGIKGTPGAIHFYCHSPPGSLTWCDNSYEAHEAALERKRKLETLSIPDVQDILLERKIPFDPENDSKELLVRKVIVTDQKKGKKTGHMVTHQHSDSCGLGCSGSAKFVKTRVAPGADYIDKKCQHGSQRFFEDTVVHTKKRDAFQASMMDHEISILMYEKETIEFSPGIHTSVFDVGCANIVHFWSSNYHELLMSDIDEQYIPRMHWSAAVHSSSNEEGGFKYARMHVTTSVILTYMMAKLALKPCLEDSEIYGFLNEPEIKGALQAISASAASLYAFMCRPERRLCECMAYVATAAEIGTLREKEMRVTTKNILLCAVCKVALAGPKVCALCKEVAYCGSAHQKEHWKLHKKMCTGRKKKGVDGLN
jgi:hypothetical protein